jgi:hypothetical protein
LGSSKLPLPSEASALMLFGAQDPSPFRADPEQVSNEGEDGPSFSFLTVTPSQKADYILPVCIFVIKSYQKQP